MKSEIAFFLIEGKSSSGDGLDALTSLRTVMNSFFL